MNVRKFILTKTTDLYLCLWDLPFLLLDVCWESYLMKSFKPSRTLAFYAMYGYKVRLK